MLMRQRYLRLAAVGLLISLGVGCKFFVAGEKLWGPAFYLAVTGNQAYVCAGRSLLVLDINDPRRPTKLGQIDFSGVATNVEISGRTAVVTVTGYGQLAIDISDPARPVKTDLSLPAARGDTRPGEFFTAPFTYLNDTCLFYVLSDAASLKFGPLDAPSEEAVVGRAVLDPECNVRGRSAVFVQPPLAYVAFERHMYAFQLGVIDVSDPAHPALLGTCPIGENVHYHPRAIVAANGFVYVAATLGGVVIVDVSDPKQPKVAARFKTSTQI